MEDKGKQIELFPNLKENLSSTVVSAKINNPLLAFFDAEKKYSISISLPEGSRIINKSKVFFSVEEVDKMKNFFSLRDVLKELIISSKLTENFVYDPTTTQKFSKLLDVTVSGNTKEDYGEFWLVKVVGKIEEEINLVKTIQDLSGKLIGTQNLYLHIFNKELISLLELIKAQADPALIPVIRPTVETSNNSYKIVISNVPHSSFTFHNTLPKTVPTKEQQIVQSYRLKILASYLENLDLQLDFFHRIYRTSNILLLNNKTYLSLESIKLATTNLDIKPNEGIGYALITECLETCPTKENLEEFEKWVKRFWKIIIFTLKSYLKKPEYINAKKMLGYFHKLETDKKIFKYPILDDVVITDFIKAIEEELEESSVKE